MAGRYVLTLTDALGVPTASLNAFVELDYVLRQDNVTPLTLRVSASLVDAEQFVIGGRIYVERAVGEGPLRLEGDMAWIIRRVDEADDDQGNSIIEVTALSAEDILDGPIVAYNSGNAYTAKVAEADDMAKAIVRENLGADATDPDRDFSAYLSVAPDDTLGPVIHKEFARRNVLTTLQEIGAAATQAGTWVGFGIVVTNQQTGALQFRTFVGQRGADRSSGAAVVEVSKGAGTLVNSRFSRDHTQERNFIYAAGGGVKDVRAVETVSDAAAIAIAPFNRRELLVDCGSTTDVGVLTNEGQAALYANRARQVLTGDLVETESVAYGETYRWGDLLLASRSGVSVPARVETVHVNVKSGAEAIQASIRGEL